MIDTIDKTMKFINLKSPEFITVTDPDISINDLQDYKHDFIRFQISADKVDLVNDSLDQSKLDIKHRIEPQKEYKEEKRLDIDHSMSDFEIVKRYCKKFNPKAEKTMLNILEKVE